ncbi:unnamed protein product, partial [Staurois parvus]
MTEQGQRMLKHTVCRSRQLSAESIAKDLQTSCGLQTSTTTKRRGCSGVKHASTGLQSSEDMF